MIVGNISSYSFGSAQIPGIHSGATISSCWRRTVAYLADGVVLYIVGFGLSTILSGPFSRMGVWGRLVGFSFAVIYFSNFDSQIGDGQTLGKRLLKLRVVNSAGARISFKMALIRSVIFEVPAFLFGASSLTMRTPWMISALILLVVYGVGGSTLYLLVFNNRTRQGLHDIAAATYIVNAAAADNGSIISLPKRMWNLHWAIIGMALVVLVAADSVVQRTLEDSASVRQLRDDAGIIERLDGVQRAQVSDLLTHTPPSGRVPHP